METMTPERATGQSVCPIFRPFRMAHDYPLAGFCAGLPGGLVMIPSVEEYRTRCSTEGHTACPIYRSRMGTTDLDSWLEAEHQQWALCAWGAPRW
jgi:hypothetical protein